MRNKEGVIVAKLNNNWQDAFSGMETEEEVIDFIVDNLDTRGWEDSYNQMGMGDPSTSFKVTVEDKKDLVREFLMELIDED